VPADAFLEVFKLRDVDVIVADEEKSLSPGHSR
jgi:hypothetical protein